MATRFTHFCRSVFIMLAMLGGTSASAQLPGYASSQAFTITNNTATLVLNYQVPVILNTQALITSSQMLATGADIRFHATCGGGTIFNHYLDTGLNTMATRIWVKVDSLLPSASKVIYLSYNNPTATNTSTLAVFNGPFSSTNQVTGGAAGGSALSQRGFRFSPNSDILVTQFGKSEPTGTTRTVTLFNYTTTAIVQQGTVSGASAVYSYNNLTSPLWLTAGTQYLLELYSGAGDGYYFGASSQINSNLTYYDMRYCNACLSTTFPTSVLTNLHYGYPDFNFYTRNTVTPAPTITSGGTSGSAPTVSISSNPSGAVCSGGPVTFTAVPTNGGTGPTYQWYRNSAAVAIGPSYTLAAPVNGDQIYVVLTSNSVCASSSNATSSTLTLAVGATPAQPGAITGNTTPCSGNTMTYSIAAVSGASAYTWTVPAGWTILSGQGTTSITAGVTASSGNISVTAGNTTCGNSAARTTTVTVGTTLSAPGTISGNTAVCGTASQPYSIAAISGATIYNWTLPPGWVILSGAGTPSIIVMPAVASGNISVTATNACNTSTSSQLAITSGVVPAAPAPVTGNPTVCAGSVNIYSVPASSGITYNWSVPAGWTFSQSGNSINATAGSTSGNISVTATNGSCGTSTATSYPILVNPVLTPAVATVNSSTGNSICTGANITFTANGSGGGTTPTYQWRVNGVNIAGATASTYSSSTLQNGDAVTVVMTAVYSCLTAPSAASAPVTITVLPLVTPGINVNTTPSTIFCSGASLTFTTITTGGGVSPSFQWYRNSTAIPGIITPTYTTSALSNGDSISVQMTTSTACPLMPSVRSNKVGLIVNPIVIPAISISANPSTTVAAGATVIFSATITNGGPMPEIQWLKNGQSISLATGNSYSTSNLRDGDVISARLTSSAPCANPLTITTPALRMSIATGIGQQMNSMWAGSLTLYPNPNSGYFTIACDWGVEHMSEKVKIEIVNSVGQQIYKNELVPNAKQWSSPIWLGSEVANGLYQIRVHTETMNAVKSMSINR